MPHSDNTSSKTIEPLYEVRRAAEEKARAEVAVERNITASRDELLDAHLKLEKEDDRSPKCL